MADESTQSIVVDAPPQDIMAVIADFPAYPEWANAMKKTEVLDEFEDGKAREVRFTLDAGPFKDVYTLAYDWADDGLSRGLAPGQGPDAEGAEGPVPAHAGGRQDAGSPTRCRCSWPCR